jgi:hypothetical protein
MSNQLSQIPIEVLILSDAPIAVRLSQLPVEVLHSATPEVMVSERVEFFVWMPV